MSEITLHERVKSGHYRIVVPTEVPDPQNPEQLIPANVEHTFPPQPPAEAEVSNEDEYIAWQRAQVALEHAEPKQYKPRDLTPKDRDLSKHLPK